MGREIQDSTIHPVMHRSCMCIGVSNVTVGEGVVWYVCEQYKSILVQRWEQTCFDWCQITNTKCLIIVSNQTDLIWHVGGESFENSSQINEVLFLG